MHSDYGVGFLPVYFYRLLPTFSRNLLPPASTWKWRQVPPKCWLPPMKLNGVITHNTIIFIMLNFISHILKQQHIQHALPHAQCGVIWFKINCSPYECMSTHPSDQACTAHKPFQWWGTGTTVFMLYSIFIRGSYCYIIKNKHISWKRISLLYGCSLYCLQILLLLLIKSY